MNSSLKSQAVISNTVERSILLLRGHRVMLDQALAELYEVPAKVLNQAVKRNIERFPEDFMFQLTLEEAQRSRSQVVTLNVQPHEIIESSPRRGRNLKYLPYAFTEQGVAMLSTVLRSSRAVQVNIEIMRAFVRLRQMLQRNTELARQLAALEKKYDAQFKVVFDAIRGLMTPPAKSMRRIGLRTELTRRRSASLGATTFIRRAWRHSWSCCSSVQQADDASKRARLVLRQLLAKVATEFIFRQHACEIVE
jgi:hypothetical protein